MMLKHWRLRNSDTLAKAPYPYDLEGPSLRTGLLFVQERCYLETLFAPSLNWEAQHREESRNDQ